jgi:hypothetical protein
LNLNVYSHCSTTRKEKKEGKKKGKHKKFFFTKLKMENSNNKEEENGRDVIVSKLKNTKLFGADLIFGMIAGSWAFNLNVATSDRVS